MNSISNITELEKRTSTFFNMHWNSEVFGEAPKWSQPWWFEGPIPNHQYRGCYAFFNDKEELIYVGIGVGKNKQGLYIGHGLGNRLKRIRSTKSKGIYTQTPGYEDVDHIRTISFGESDDSPFWLAAALEIYLIIQLQPKNNITHNQRKV